MFFPGGEIKSSLLKSIYLIFPLHAISSVSLQESIVAYASFCKHPGPAMCKSDLLFEFISGRIWKIATLSFGGAVIPVPGLSIAADITLLTLEMKLYKSQLGLPEENSTEFQRMATENQAKVRQFCITSAATVAKYFVSYAASSAVEEVARFIPILGIAVAGSISFSSTYYFLHRCLDNIERTAMDYLDEINIKIKID